MILAIDFDNTIIEENFPMTGPLIIDHETGKTSKDYINMLYAEGHKIIIWTCRYRPNDLKIMRDFLEENDIKYHTINENIPGLSFWPTPKIYADIYIDDRQVVPLPRWEIIYNYVQYKKSDLKITIDKTLENQE